MLKIFKKKGQNIPVKSVDNTREVPKHIAFICDGNRRWATNRGMPPLEGHYAGLTIFEPLVDHLLASGITTISFYIFSTENWNRSKEEVDYLMALFYSEMKKNLKRAVKKNIRFKVIGSRDRLPKKLADMCDRLEQESLENTNGTVVFALNYGGQDEMVRAAKKAIDSGISADNLTKETFETFLDSGDLLPIDLMVRASNEHRISNFMLWKLAYAELMFIPEHWPDVKPKVLDRILVDYTKRNRRFGGGVYKDYSKKKINKTVKK